MSDLKLEVGKYYTTNSPRIEKIIGTIYKTYIEYEKGARFYSEEGHIYTEDGRNLNSVIDMDIVSEIKDPELIKGDAATQWNHGNSIETAYFSPAMNISIGKTYVNSLGYLVTIKDQSMDVGSGYFYKGTDDNFYFADGRVFLYGIEERNPSVYDLVRYVVNHKTGLNVSLDQSYNGEEALPDNDQKKEDNIFTLMEDIGLALHTAKKLGIKLNISIEA